MSSSSGGGDGGSEEEPRSEHEARWVDVSSGNVDAVAWWRDPSGGPTLGVRFRSRPSRPRRDVYHYPGVPRELYLEMLAAASPGGFIWGRLRADVGRGQYRGHWVRSE